jgi:hypothetical protein
MDGLDRVHVQSVHACPWTEQSIPISGLGFRLNRDLLNDLLHHTTDFDFDAYLTNDPPTWLQQQLEQIFNQLGITSGIDSSHFRHNGQPVGRLCPTVTGFW